MFNPNAEVEAINKSIVDAMKTPSEDIARTIMASAGMRPDELNKTIATGTGLVAYDLQAPAKNLYPVFTPIRNVLPRVPGGIGLGTNWRQVNAIAGSGYDAMGWVPEGGRSGQMSYSTSNKFVGYATLGEEDAATFEAIAAGRSFEDIQAGMTRRMLQKTMLKEESALIGGNMSLQLGTPTTPTLATAVVAGATLPALTYSVYVVALSFEGYLNATKTGTLAVATTKTITGADGKTFTLNGGSSNKSANATLAVSLGSSLTATVPLIQGAVAWAWFVGAVGQETLQAITTINSIALTSPLSSGNQNASAVTADYSTNSTAFNGLITTAAIAGSGAFLPAQATGVAGVGTALTPSGRGSVIEIDTLMLNMWNAYQVSLDVIYVNAQELKNITAKVLSSNSGASLLQFFKDPNSAEYALTAGGAIEFYYNPFMAPGAGRKIPIRIHPFLPPGTILGWASNLPIQYQSNEVPTVAEVKIRTDYYQIDWPLVTRQRQVGVYVEEALAVYAPFTIGIIGNIANG